MADTGRMDLLLPRAKARELDALRRVWEADVLAGRMSAADFRRRCSAYVEDNVLCRMDGGPWRLLRDLRDA